MKSGQLKRSNSFLSALFVGYLLLGHSLDAEGVTADRSELKYSFEKVKRLPLGSSQQEAEAVFGRPSKVFKEKISSDVSWVYIEGTEILNRAQRLGLSFAGSPLKLTGIYYYPKPPDTVAFVAGLKAEFPKANFKTVEPSNCGEHFTINEGFSYDLEFGITYEKDETGAVTDLRLVAPLTTEQRKTASEPTGCPDKKKKRRQLIEITPALK